MVDDERVQAMAVNQVIARACDAAGNLAVGLGCHVIKAQDASIACVAWCRLMRFGKTQPGPPNRRRQTQPVPGAAWSHFNKRHFNKRHLDKGTELAEQIESELAVASVVEELPVKLLPGGIGSRKSAQLELKLSRVLFFRMVTVT